MAQTVRALGIYCSFSGVTVSPFVVTVSFWVVELINEGVFLCETTVWMVGCNLRGKLELIHVHPSLAGLQKKKVCSWKPQTEGKKDTISFLSNFIYSLTSFFFPSVEAHLA